MSNVRFIDTHCHIHASEFAERFDGSVEDVLARSREAGIAAFVFVGTDALSSEEAVLLARKQPDCYASVALHPHEAAEVSEIKLKASVKKLDELLETDQKDPQRRIVAVGECGLDYYYHDASEVIERQKWLFKEHIQLAKKYQLPMIFHVRDAFDDFFNILDEYSGIRGVVHSFSARSSELQEVLKRGLYVGLNGIMTFTKDSQQLAAAKAVPLEKIVLETDAPFLTPVPFRGTMCEPKHLTCTAEFLSVLRSEPLDLLASQTTKNVSTLFKINL